MKKGILTDDRDKYVIGGLASKLSNKLLKTFSKDKEVKELVNEIEKTKKDIKNEKYLEVKEELKELRTSENESYDFEEITEQTKPEYYTDKVDFLEKELNTLLKNKRDKKMSGGQAKLDVDKDGELTAKDFEALRERTQKQMGGMMAGMPIGNEEEMQEPMAEKTVSEEMQEELEPLPEEPMEEPMMSEESQMDSDDEMEDKYLDFVINQALSEEEEEMLMNELESNPNLSLLFDKVMDVAQEFSGSGPVEGPGSEVSDSIPARLSDGEFVFTAKAVEEIGADTLMSMMKEAEVNADERQQVAYGGTVTTTVRQEEDDYDFGANPEEQELRNAAVSEQMRNLNPRLR